MLYLCSRCYIFNREGLEESVTCVTVVSLQMLKHKRHKVAHVQ